ncbi:hypothetical protein POPTR_T011801v4 [Populus trichocarpa]|uniref:Uncharacterized protein n=2 Tax=Populus trichocarpa TaxID=3694 RepID=A0ACC0RHE8_POPTR|nr:hypothetical protein POPTR_T011801v4 [Populus trichocarpa]
MFSCILSTGLLVVGEVLTASESNGTISTRQLIRYYHAFGCLHLSAVIGSNPILTKSNDINFHEPFFKAWELFSQGRL